MKKIVKKLVFSILSICGLLSLTSCRYGTELYVDLDDTNHITYVVTSIEKLYGDHFEQKNTAQYKAVNKYGCKLMINGNADRLSYGDTLIITKK